MTLPPGPETDFHTFRYRRNTARRLEHLATLHLKLRDRNALEVGAGVGDLTQFFVDRGTRVHATDARPSHVKVLRERYASHPLVTSDVLDLDSPPQASEVFELVVCYGVLYHVADPLAVVQFLSESCSDLLLLETIVGDGDANAINPYAENRALAGAAYSGLGCRPSRAWVLARLREQFAHVYLPMTQPNHYEFPIDWTVPGRFARRAIFVASRRPLQNPLLVTDLPERQLRH